MPSKFEAFTAALADLCRAHQVILRPTTSTSSLCVWDADGEETPVEGLENRTKPEFISELANRPPEFFTTAIEAQAFPGYLGHTRTRSQADVMAAARPGALVVPIGPFRFERGFAVISPEEAAPAAQPAPAARRRKPRPA